MTKEIPEYYKGKNGYMAKDAVTYLLRSKKKHNDGGIEDIRKAIHHLHFELDVLTTKTLTGALAPTGTNK